MLRRRAIMQSPRRDRSRTGLAGHSRVRGRTGSIQDMRGPPNANQHRIGARSRIYLPEMVLTSVPKKVDAWPTGVRSSRVPTRRERHRVVTNLASFMSGARSCGLGLWEPCSMRHKGAQTCHLNARLIVLACALGAALQGGCTGPAAIPVANPTQIHAGMTRQEVLA